MEENRAEVTGMVNAGVGTNIDLSAIRKKRFTINGDPGKVLEINTSDFGVIARLEESEQKLTDLTLKIADFDKDGDKSLGQKIAEVDGELRKIIDYIFDANVCEVCVPNGTLIDPIDGKFRWEYVVEILTNLYDSSLSAETKKVTERIKTHTDKYTNQ